MDFTELDFTDARAGSGAKLLTIERARCLTDLAEARNMFVQSMEAFNLLEDNVIQPNLEFSMLDLGYDEHAAATPQALNEVARSIFDLAEQLDRRIGFDVWLTPDADFAPTKR